MSTRNLRKVYGKRDTRFEALKGIDLDIYEGWPHLYRKETLKIKLGKKILPAMIYIMNGEKYPYGYPSQLYFDTIRDGYISAGFDPKLLHQAVAENMKGERLYG